MGFFKWIKRELDAPGSCKRRQSEPPIVYGCLNSNTSRDESYIRAIFKFNEWRRCQRTQNSRYATGKSSKRQTSRFYTKVEKMCAANSVNMLSATSFSGTPINSNGIYEEIQPGVNNANTYLEDIPKKECNSAKQNSKSRRRKHKRRSLCEHEAVEPDNIPQTASPPILFYRENSNPYFDFPSPNKCTVHSHFPHHHEKGEAHSDNEKKSCLSQHHLNSTRQSVILSLKKDCNHNMHNPLPDVLADHNDSSGKLSSLSYQKIINIRGEEVEYALPYCEKNVINPQITDELNAEESFSIYDNVPDEIRTNKNQSPERSMVSHPLAGKFSDCRRSSQIIVTDLDNSIGPTETLKGDIFRELSTLEMWSKNICLEDEDNRSMQNSVNDTLSKSSVIVCRDVEVPESCMLSKVNETTPVFIRPGRFRKAIVTKYYVDHSDKSIVEKALYHNFLIMRKIRHPNISLLMATVCDVNQKFRSLILEPFSCSLNNLIYESGTELPVKDCLNYTIQITKAVVYLHANGLIHSNISNNNIFICQYNKQAKLSSFQLTTFCKINIQKEISRLYENETIPGLTEVPTKYLPHFMEYRKIFSKYNYQAPELITSQDKFVFPCKQSDVYGITMCLWEMLNRRIPFALFSYYEMEKIFYLKQAQLPNFDSKRCENLHSLLENGLRINPNERVQTAEKLYRMVQDIKSNFETEGKISKRIPKNADKVTALPQMNACTSTMKRKKVLSSCPSITSPLFEDKTNKNCIDTEESTGNNSNSKDESREYLFEIDHISLPETPIARQNKIRRTAWLTNKVVSPSNASRGCSEEVKKANMTIDTPPSSKKYNINITIMHSDPAGDPLASPKRPVNIQSQIQYWNSLMSPSELALNTGRSTNPNKDIRNQDTFVNSPQIKPMIAKNNSEQKLDPDEMLETKKFSSSSNYYPSMPEMLSESFCKKDKSTDEDFEKVFWRREKERCEKSSPSTPRRTSVKEAVHKFEQIRSGASNTSPFPKNMNSKNSDKDVIPFRPITDGLQSIRRNLNLEKKNRKAEVNQVLYQSQDSTFEENQSYENEDSKNATYFSFEKQCHRDKVQLSEQCSTTETSATELKEEKAITSKLNVILSNDLNKNSRKSRSNPELNKLNTIDARLKRQNEKKLVRRASDVGCVSQRIIQTTREFKTANDSVGGTEWREQITLFSSEINFSSPQLSSYCDLFLKNSQLYREISCRDCGSHNVCIGDSLRRYLQFQNPQIVNSSIDAGRARNTISTVNESLEDLYIDDDLNYGPKLAPNMKLTKPELSIFSSTYGALNFNTSSISSSDLKLSDESLISNEDNGHN